VKTAILFFTHLFTPGILAAFEKLRRESSAFGDLFILCENKSRPPKYLQGLCKTFDIRELAARYPQIPHASVIPGNTHLAFCHFSERHPDYDTIWFIEYDVRFSGSWSRFFAHHHASPSDLLACHLRTHAEEPQWCWWPTLTDNRGPLPPEQRLRSFLPICRISRRALRMVSKRLQEGWTGHCEALLPTVLALGGLLIEDLGGTGSFTRETNRGSWYTSPSSDDGGLRDSGTHRFRPPHQTWGEEPEMIYHPVKRERLPLGTHLRLLRQRFLPGTGRQER